ncbi:MAG: hypothetical protein HOO96_38660 [Polyangiaceae bacterium]|nr:hypothetical protein [Polyangiaceae bacterium]
MAFTELYQGSASISTTEYSLTNGSTTIATVTTDAVLSVWLDLNAMAAGDEYELVLREKVTSGGTQRTLVLGTFWGTQSEFYISGPFQVLHGWDVTLRKRAGTDRTIGWSLRGVT